MKEIEEIEVNSLQKKKNIKLKNENYTKYLNFPTLEI